jgi:6-phosphofructo-2-kinase
MTSATSPEIDQRNNNVKNNGSGSGKDGALMPPPKTVVNRALGNDLHSDVKSSQPPKGGVGTALTDTPVSTAPPSPQM